MVENDQPIRYSEEIFPGEGEVADESTRNFLAGFMEQFAIYIERWRRASVGVWAFDTNGSVM